MHVVVDYRPALRARTGIGEYVHELARALTEAPAAGDRLTLFSSSWADRLPPDTARDIPAAARIDRRLPVRALSWAWHRAGWPPIELLAGACDLVHSPTPLLVPARRAAQVVTVHDLYFLRRDAAEPGTGHRHLPRLIDAHVRRADHVIAVSGYTAGLVEHQLGIPAERITTTPLGAPRWADEVCAARGGRRGRTILFVGTLEPRKNLGVLLDAYEALLGRGDAPPLVLAGQATPAASAWLARLQRPPLAGRVTTPGYVDDATRRRLYAEARMLVLPSVDEGFGLPALEAMACGVPVVAAAAGSLPEVVGAAGVLVDPRDTAAWTAAMATLLDDAPAQAYADAGRRRAAAFSWPETARRTRRAYAAAVDARRERRR